MICGKPSPMISSFKLSYYTMLNMLRRLEGSQHNMEYVIKNSFQQFQQERALPEVSERKGNGCIGLGGQVKPTLPARNGLARDRLSNHGAQ